MIKYIYIPLCFYFINIGTAGSFYDIIFTFHYASTLSETADCRGVCSLIYIPLCFYFILMPVGHWSVYSPFTFHYASTLSSGYWPYSTAITKFTFHYASTLSQADRSAHVLIKIYIPLCFYFIVWEAVSQPPPSKFTFHYASTLSTSDI